MNNQLIKIPNFNFTSKNADIKAHRDGDFHYSWDLGGGKLLSVEYIPENSPEIEVRVTTDTVEGMVKILKEINFNVGD